MNADVQFFFLLLQSHRWETLEYKVGFELTLALNSCFKICIACNLQLCQSCPSATSGTIKVAFADNVRQSILSQAFSKCCHNCLPAQSSQFSPCETLSALSHCLQVHVISKNVGLCVDPQHFQSALFIGWRHIQHLHPTSTIRMNLKLNEVKAVTCIKT